MDLSFHQIVISLVLLSKYNKRTAYSLMRESFKYDDFLFSDVEILQKNFYLIDSGPDLVYIQRVLDTNSRNSIVLVVTSDNQTEISEEYLKSPENGRLKVQIQKALCRLKWMCLRV